MKPSRAEEYLKGKLLPDSTSPIKSVTANGNRRTIILEDGRRIVTNKQGLRTQLFQVMSREQSRVAKASLRVASNGKASVTLGGSVQGERKTYTSRAGALKAITRFYGKS